MKIKNGITFKLNKEIWEFEGVFFNGFIKCFTKCKSILKFQLCHFNNKYINIIVKIKNIYNNKIEWLCEMIVVLYKEIRKDRVWIEKKKEG